MGNVVETRQLRPKAPMPAPRVESLLKAPARSELVLVSERDSVKDSSSVRGAEGPGSYDPEVDGVLVVAGDAASAFETGGDDAPDAESTPAALPTLPATLAAAEEQQEQQEEQPSSDGSKKNGENITESHSIPHQPPTASPGIHIKLEYESITINGENNVVMGFSSDFLTQAQKHPTGVTFEVKCGPINIASSSRNIKVGHCVN